MNRIQQRIINLNREQLIEVIQNLQSDLTPQEVEESKQLIQLIQVFNQDQLSDMLALTADTYRDMAPDAWWSVMLAKVEDDFFKSDFFKSWEVSLQHGVDQQGGTLITVF